MWTFEELGVDELRRFANRPCECVTPEKAGTRHGFRCPAHRASVELARRTPESEGTNE